jgi:hypothetical protein
MSKVEGWIEGIERDVKSAKAHSKLEGLCKACEGLLKVELRSNVVNPVCSHEKMENAKSALRDHVVSSLGLNMATHTRTCAFDLHKTHGYTPTHAMH